MKSFFITATGTDIGKTRLTTALCRHLIRQNYRVRCLKPVISGWQMEGNESDTALILRSLGLAISPETIDMVSPWRFTAPLSPDMAAAREGKMLDVDEIADFCNHSPFPYDYQLIEGVGGVMVPLNGRHTIRDLIQRVHSHIILVTGSYLGSLSHTLSAVEALKARQLQVACVAVSESADSTVSMDDTLASLRRFIDVPIIGLNRLAGDAIWDDAVLAGMLR